MDLTIPGMTTNLAERVRAGIDRATVSAPRYSWRLKPSSLGGECTAKIWYAWRWVKKTAPEPRFNRIFGTGHAFEAPIMDWLRNDGWTVLDKDPAKIGTKFEQWNVKALNGHLSAYLDAAGSHPEYTSGLWVNLEAKSYKKSRFNQLVSKKNVKVVDYEYYVQACIYCYLMDLAFTVLVAVCKDDCEVHVDVIPRDDATAIRALQLAESVATSRIRPGRIAQSAAFHACQRCEYKGVCHLGDKPDVNCRSCLNCVPADGGKFYCAKFNVAINDETAISEYPIQCGGYEGVA